MCFYYFALSFRCVGGQLHSNQSAVLLFGIIVLSNCCQPHLIEDRVISIPPACLSVIRHASAPRESWEQTMAAPALHTRFHSGGSRLLWWVKKTKRAWQLSVCYHTDHTCCCVQTDRVSPCYVTAWGALCCLWQRCGSD